MSSQSHVQRTSRTQFGMVDARIIRDPSLPLNVKNVYTYLATFCGNAREAFPSRARIARELGMSVRTVDTANKVAKEAGLWSVARKAPEPGYPAYAKHHQPNIYLLHDFDGGYEVGSGPLAQPLRQGEAQPLQGPGAAVAHYQDHSSEPSTSQRPTNTPPGGDDVTSSRRKHVSDQMRFFKPKGFDRMDDVRIAGALPGVFIKIMERHGLDPHDQGVHEIGNWTKKCFDNGYTRNEVWRTFQTIVRQAVAGERHEWLVKWGEAA